MPSPEISGSLHRLLGIRTGVFAAMPIRCCTVNFFLRQSLLSASRFSPVYWEGHPCRKSWTVPKPRT